MFESNKPVFLLADLPGPASRWAHPTAPTATLRYVHPFSRLMAPLHGSKLYKLTRLGACAGEMLGQMFPMVNISLKGLYR